MDSQRCPSCSEPTQPRGCQRQWTPSNLELVQKVLHKPKKPRCCTRSCVLNFVKTAVAVGKNINCSCNVGDSLSSSSDHRLKRWEEELQLRNGIAKRLMQRTGKSACELLFNRPVTVNTRDKLMIKRLLEHAERRKPNARQTQAVIREQLPNGCFIEEMTSAKPKRKKFFEITGLPAGVKCELIGENCCVRRSGWLVSRTVREQIAARSTNIKRVVPFFPDIEYLQVIGKKMTIYKKDVGGKADDENGDESDVRFFCATPCNDICSSRFGATLAATQEIYHDCNECPICSPRSCTAEADFSGEDNEKASYKIYCCLRDRINQSEEDYYLHPTASCSNNLDMYDELTNNRARCHNVFFDL